VTVTNYDSYIKWFTNLSKDTNIKTGHGTTNTIREINFLQYIKDDFDCSGI